MGLTSNTGLLASVPHKPTLSKQKVGIEKLYPVSTYESNVNICFFHENVHRKIFGRVSKKRVRVSLVHTLYKLRADMYRDLYLHKSGTFMQLAHLVRKTCDTDRCGLVRICIQFEIRGLSPNV